jgi:hypothetical protein
MAFVTGMTMLAYDARFLCAALDPQPRPSPTDNVLHTLLAFSTSAWTSASHVTNRRPYKELSVAGGVDFQQVLDANLKQLATSLQRVPSGRNAEHEEWDVVDKDEDRR